MASYCYVDNCTYKKLFRVNIQLMMMCIQIFLNLFKFNIFYVIIQASIIGNNIINYLGVIIYKYLLNIHLISAYSS